MYRNLTSRTNATTWATFGGTDISNHDTGHWDLVSYVLTYLGMVHLGG